MSYSIQKAKSIQTSDYINEIFIYFASPISTVKKSIQSLSFIYQAYLLCKSICLILFAFVITVLSSLLLPVYLLFRLDSRPLNFDCKHLVKIAVFRNPAAYQKMKFLKNENVYFLSDSLVYKNKEVNSLYSMIKFSNRLCSLLWVPVFSVVDFYKIILDSKNIVSFMSLGKVTLFFSKRIAQKCNFEFYVSSVLKSNPVRVYYTGNKEDRFAMMEDRLCKRYEVESICIPHGLEYAYKMPGGLVGDKFYCTSENARALLSKLYEDGKNLFIFDQGIVSKMLSVGRLSQQNKKIVFFPESRDPKTNLLIMKYLIDSGFKLHVKFHIKDNI